MRLISALILLFIPVASIAQNSMDVLVSEALRANPGIKSLDEQVRALRAGAEASQKWKDPVLSAEYSNFPWDTWSLGDSPMTGVQVKIEQTFPFPGKNDRRKAAAEAGTEVIKLQRDELVNQLSGLVKSQYLDLTLVRQLKALTEKHINIVAGLLDRVRVSYEVGKGNQKDVLRLELLKQKLADDVMDFDRKDREITATLNSALHRDMSGEISTPARIQTGKTALPPEKLAEAAVKNRPLLAQIRARAAMLRLAADEADWDRWPDLSLWLGYRFRMQSGVDDGSDFMSLGLGVPLPFNYTDSSDAKKQQLLSMAASAEFEYKALLDRIKAEIEQSLAAWNRAVQKSGNYRNRLVPAAQKTLDASLLAYETDRADFFSIYRAELDLLEFERAITTASIQAARMKARIETVTGTDLDEVGEK